jgi:hypothetical protein
LLGRQRCWFSLPAPAQIAQHASTALEERQRGRNRCGACTAAAGRNGYGQFGVNGYQNPPVRIFAMPKVEDPPVDDVVLMKDATSGSDAGVAGFNAPDGALLVTLLLAGLFAIGYFIFG